MIDYYKILNLSLQKQNGKITDEMVKRNYLAKIKIYQKMKEKEKYIKSKGKGQRLRLEKAEENLSRFNSEEMNEYLLGDYLTLLQNAYNAIKTESDRKRYDEYCKEMEKRKQNTDNAEREINNQTKNDIETKQVQKPEKEIELISLTRSTHQRRPIQQGRTTQPTQLTQQVRTTQPTQSTQQEQSTEPKKEIKYIPITRSTQRMIQNQQIIREQRTKQSEVSPFQRMIEVINDNKSNTSQMVKEITKRSPRQYQIKNQKKNDREDMDR